MQHESVPGTKRTYRKKERAESERQTRKRITEAALALHETVGPARTSVKAVAEKARVDRATVYRHFPDEEALFDACTTHYYARHPMPDPERWRTITPPDARLEAALADLYAWFAETEQMLSLGIRDLDSVPAGAREAFLGYFDAVRTALMTGRPERRSARARVSAAIGLATSFATWRTLIREEQMSLDDGVELMTFMVRAVAGLRG